MKGVHYESQFQIPTMSATKKAMLAFLEEHGIEHNAMLKKSLLFETYLAILNPAEFNKCAAEKICSDWSAETGHLPIEVHRSNNLKQIIHYRFSVCRLITAF
jgi:hypothetical protein